MPNKTIITAAAGIVAATGIVITVASLANASTSTSPSALPGYSLGYDQQSGEGRGQDGPQGGGTHTAVTGAELTKVTAAVKAKDSTVTVTSVRKDEDGSYDVMGTKAGAPVMLEVSKDLATITTRTGGPGGRDGGHGPDGDGDGPGAPASGSTGGSGSSGSESNGTASNGTASTTAYRTV